MNPPKKYRVWDHITKSFSYFDIRSTMGMIPNDIPDDAIQQFTGLLDMNGREIFQGDHVILRTIAHTYHTKVIFVEGCFAFKILSGSNTLSIIFAHMVSQGDFESEVFGKFYLDSETGMEIQ